jgi:F-type H+-transporting ATPase subunit a
MLKSKFLIILFNLFLFTSFAFGADDLKNEGNGKFNAGETIMEHVTDNHSWHIISNVSLPLPVIIYSDKGIDCFSSAKFEEGNANYQGNYNYGLIKGHIKAIGADNKIDEAATAKIWDFSITKNVASLFIGITVMLLIFLSVAKSYKRNAGKAPSGLQSWIEPLILFVRDEVAKPSIGEKHYRRFMPYLLTIFFFIWINNLLGLIPIFPGGVNLTGNIAITLTLAVLTFIITTLNGNKHYWRHIFAMPGVPLWVLPLITLIEIMGVFLKPFVLMIRLFANIVAGHIVVLCLVSLIFIFGEMAAWLGYAVSPLSMLFSVFMIALDFLVSFLQAYVFALLSAIYFGSAVEDHHHPPQVNDTEQQALV